MLSKGANLKPVWVFKQGDLGDIFNLKGNPPEQILLLDRSDIEGVHDKQFDEKVYGGNFYRSDDVSSTAYFYLSKPTNNLPPLTDISNRINGLKEKVWNIKKSEK
jgi:hypothetical protein